MQTFLASTSLSPVLLTSLSTAFSIYSSCTISGRTIGIALLPIDVNNKTEISPLPISVCF